MPEYSLYYSYYLDIRNTIDSNWNVFCLAISILSFPGYIIYRYKEFRKYTSVIKEYLFSIPDNFYGTLKPCIETSIIVYDVSHNSMSVPIFKLVFERNNNLPYIHNAIEEFKAFNHPKAIERVRQFSDMVDIFRQEIDDYFINLHKITEDTEKLKPIIDRVNHIFTQKAQNDLAEFYANFNYPEWEDEDTDCLVSQSKKPYLHLAKPERIPIIFKGEAIKPFGKQLEGEWDDTESNEIRELLPDPIEYTYPFIYQKKQLEEMYKNIGRGFSWWTLLYPWKS